MIRVKPTLEEMLLSAFPFPLPWKRIKPTARVTPTVTKSSAAGRPKVHTSDAERQRAYRARRKLRKINTE